MDRNKLCGIIYQCVQDILKQFCERNYLVYTSDLIFKGTEIYKTSNMIGAITFELEPYNDIESELSGRDLSLLAQKLVDLKYKDYIHQIEFKKLDETDYITKVVVKLNFSDINEYIIEFQDKVFKQLGFNSYDSFLTYFHEDSLQHMLEEAPRVYRNYSFNDSQTSFKVRIENDDYFLTYKDFLGHISVYDHIKCVDTRRKIFMYRNNGKCTFIRFQLKHGNCYIQFEESKDLFDEQSVDIAIKEINNSNSLTFKFLSQEEK